MKSWFRNNDFWGKKYTFFFVKKTFFVFSKKHIFKIFFESAIVWHLPSKSINFYGFFIITFFLNFGELKIVTKMTLDMQNGISGVQFASTWGRRNRKKCVFSSKWAIIFQKNVPFSKMSRPDGFYFESSEFAGTYQPVHALYTSGLDLNFPKMSPKMWESSELQLSIDSDALYSSGLELNFPKRTVSTSRAPNLQGN